MNKHIVAISLVVLLCMIIPEVAFATRLEAQVDIRKITPPRLQLLPDLTISKVSLNEGNRICFTIENLGPGSVPNEAYETTDLRISRPCRIVVRYGGMDKSFTLVQVDPHKRLQQRQKSLQFCTGIILNQKANVRVSTDVDGTVVEKNETNNLLSANLTPLSLDSYRLTTPVIEARGCVHNLETTITNHSGRLISPLYAELQQRVGGLERPIFKKEIFPEIPVNGSETVGFGLVTHPGATAVRVEITNRSRLKVGQSQWVPYKPVTFHASIQNVQFLQSGSMTTWSATIQNHSKLDVCKVRIETYKRLTDGYWVMVSFDNIDRIIRESAKTVGGQFNRDNVDRFRIKVLYIPTIQPPYDEEKQLAYWEGQI